MNVMPTAMRNACGTHSHTHAFRIPTRMRNAMHRTLRTEQNRTRRTDLYLSITHTSHSSRARNLYVDIRARVNAYAGGHR